VWQRVAVCDNIRYRCVAIDVKASCVLQRLVLKLQCDAVCCSALQCDVVCCSVLQCVAALWCSSCSVVMCVAVCCSVRLHRIQMFCNRCVQQWHRASVRVKSNTPQHTATHCNTLQHHTVAIDMLSSWLRVCPNTTAPLQCNTLQYHYSETYNMSTHQVQHTSCQHMSSYTVTANSTLKQHVLQSQERTTKSKHPWDTHY